jgi:two-component system response regulator VicR
MAAAKILIVEDDPVIRELVGMLVEQAGFQPLLAHDAAGAVALDAQHQADLAIVDVDLGRTTNGLDLLCELKTLRDLPVILLSGLSSVDVRVSGLELGADDYITKPFDNAELIARIRAHLRRAQI